MRRSNIIIGGKYGRLTVLGIGGRHPNNMIKWLCKCSCGGEKSVIASALNSGKTRSCGCLYKEARPFSNRKHGESHKTNEYHAWESMKARCYDKKLPGYKDYGGRGITVCERWLGEHGYSNFILDVGRKPTTKHSLDRFPNNDGNYEPSNCRWATKQQQNGNTRANRWIEYNGEKMILADWARKLRTGSTNILQTSKHRGMDGCIKYFMEKANLK